MTLQFSKHFALPLLIVALTACMSEKPEDFVASGRAFIEKRDFPAAIIQLKNAVQRDPQSGEARYWLAVALRQTGDVGAAEIELRKAASTSFAPDLVIPELVSSLLEAGQFEKALHQIQEAKVTTPRARAALLAAQSSISMASGKLDDARRFAVEAAAIDNGSPAPQVMLAKLAVVDRKPDEALKILADSLLKTPDDYETLRLKADLLLYQGKAPEAVATLDQVVRLRPTSVSAYLSLIPTLLQEQDIAGAEFRLSNLRRFAGGTPGVRYLEALTAYAKGDRRSARESVLQVLKSGGDYLPALLLAGTVEHDLGNYVVAEDLLQKVASAAPNDRKSRRLLVSTYLRTGQIDKARGALATLVKLDPDSSDTYVLAGQVATASKDHAKAAEFFEKAVEQDPKNATSRALLGAANVLRGDVQRGVADLEAASAADPGRIDADVALIRYFLEHRQPEKATHAVKILAKKQPNNPQTSNLRGGVLLAQGDILGARKAFENALALNPTFVPAASNLAELDIRDGKSADAMNRYRSILRKDPKSSDAALLLATLMQRYGAKDAEVDKVLADAITGVPDNPQLRLAQVMYLQQSNRKKEAVEAAQQALAAVPNNALLIGAMGRAQLMNGDYSQAIVTFGKLAALEPRSVDPLVRQSSAYIAVRDFASARSVLNKAIGIQPENLLLYASLVDLGLKELKPDTAMNDARAMQRKWPKKSAGYIAETVVLAAQHKPDEAEALLRRAARTTEDAGAALQLFSLLVGSNRGAEAEKFVADWVVFRPKDAAVASVAGDHGLEEKDYAAAVRWYRAALRAKPDNAVTLNNLAWALGQLKDPQAMATAEKAHALAPNNPAIIDTIGWLQLEQGDAKTAVVTLNRAVALSPQVASVRINFAKALIATGQKLAAKEQLLAINGLAAPRSVKEEAEKLLGSL